MFVKDLNYVRRAMSGDLESLAVLIERYTALVHGVILDEVRRSTEVDMLVAETFVQAFSGLADVSSPCRFSPWLHSVAASLASEWVGSRRQGTAEPQLRLHGFLREPIDPQDDASHNTVHLAIRTASSGSLVG